MRANRGFVEDRPRGRYGRLSADLVSSDDRCCTSSLPTTSHVEYEQHMVAAFVGVTSTREWL